ncbi:MAG: hypothetical protein V7707_15245 [Motiliproteus sp.]
MGAKVALFFLLDTTKAAAPQNYGMQLPVQKVAPLYDSLNASSRFAKMSFPDSTVYGFSFFKKPHQVDMLVVLRDLSHSSRKIFQAQCQAQLAKLLNVNINEAFHYNDYVHQALWLPRGLQKQDFLSHLCLATGEAEADLDDVSRKYLGDTWVMNYRKGFIFAGKNEADFSRSLALYGLGLAYHRQMSLMTNRLAHSADLGGDASSSIQQEVGSFMAQCLFDNPVRPAHLDTFACYEHIVKGLGLPLVEQQLRKKLNDLVQLGTLKRGREQLGGAGLGESLHTEERQSKEPKVEANTRQSTSARRVVLGVVVGVLITVGLLSLSAEPLALVQQWLK